MTGEEQKAREDRLVLAASRGVFAACTKGDSSLGACARAYSYAPRTFEGDAFETAYEWAKEELR